jgi:gluconolactonase
MIWCLGAPALALGQAPAPAAGSDQTPNIPGVVAAGTKVQLVGANFEGASGTVPAPDGSLLLSNRDVNKVTKIAADGTISVYPVKVDLPNGIAIDHQGRLVAAQWTRPPQIGVIGDKTVMLANKFERRSFGGINDLVVDMKGGAYFTDHIDAVVYYTNASGQVTKVDDTMVRPNGIILSPDGKVLYASDTQGPAIIAWDVQPDGSTRNRREFAKLEGVRKTEAGFASGADGITIDAAGRLYVTANLGVQVFSPQGQYLGTIPVPKGRMQSVAFAGADKKTLYITGDNIVYKVAMQAEGFKGRPK